MAEGNHFDPDARGKDSKLPMSVDDDKRRTSPVLAHGRYVAPGAVRGKWIPLKVMADGTVVTTGGGGPSLPCLGNFVFIAGPLAAGVTYPTAQAAADAAAAAALANPGQNMVVLLTPGYYPEDVLIRSDRIRVFGLGAIGAVVVESLTWTDSTLAGLAAFNATGLPASLVRDPLVPQVVNGSVENVIVMRTVGGWHAGATSSMRLLGSDTPSGLFMSDGFDVTHVYAGAANGAPAGLGGLLTMQSGSVSQEDSMIAGILAYQPCFMEADDVRVDGDWFTFYNAILTEPVGGHQGVKAHHTTIGRQMKVTGAEAYWALLSCCEMDNLFCGSSSVLSVSTLEECFVRGAIFMQNVGPTVNFLAGRHMVLPGGPGVAGFLPVVGFNS
jgi:hypothetical protein